MYDDEGSSVKSDNSDRRVKMSKRNDSIPNITVQRNVETDSSSYKRHSNFNQSFGNSYDSKRPFDKANSNNLFEKSQDKKKYGDSETTHRSFAQRNGENKNPNIQNSNRGPGPHNVDSKFSKDSARPQRHFEARNQNYAKGKDEDWDSPGSTQPKVEKSSPKNAKSSFNKVESFPKNAQRSFDKVESFSKNGQCSFDKVESSPKNAQCKFPDKAEKPSRESAERSSVKVETVSPVPVSSKVEVSKPVQVSGHATKSKDKVELNTVELPENQFTEVSYPLNCLRDITF